MTVVNPKSISGITSITTASGSDDLLTIHTNNGTERLRIDSTGATKIVTGIVTTLTATTGIVTTLTANTVTSLGTVTAAYYVGSGAASLSASSNADELVIGASNGTRGITIFGATSNIFFGDSGDNDIGQIQYEHSDNSMRFNTNASERLRIASDGDIGIGTITPQNNARLQVSTSNQVVAAFEGTGGSDPQIYLGDDMTTPTDNCIIMGYDKADNRGYLTVGGDGDTVFTVKNGGDIEIGGGNLKF